MEWSSDEIDGAITVAAKDLGFSTLTGEQTLVLQAFLSGKDVFVSLPTGSGKSPGTFDILKKSRCSIVLVAVADLGGVQRFPWNPPFWLSPK